MTMHIKNDDSSKYYSFFSNQSTSVDFMLDNIFTGHASLYFCFVLIKEKSTDEGFRHNYFKR